MALSLPWPRPTLRISKDRALGTASFSSSVIASPCAAWPGRAGTAPSQPRRSTLLLKRAEAWHAMNAEPLFVMTSALMGEGDSSAISMRATSVPLAACQPRPPVPTTRVLASDLFRSASSLEHETMASGTGVPAFIGYYFITSLAGPPDLMSEFRLSR